MSDQRPCLFHERLGRFDPFCRNCQPLTDDQRRIKELETELAEAKEADALLRGSLRLAALAADKAEGDLERLLGLRWRPADLQEEFERLSAPKEDKDG